MGCTKSEPMAPPLQPLLIPSEVELPRKKRTMKKNCFVTKEVSSISLYFDIISVIGSLTIGTLLYARDLHSGTYRTIREVSKSIAIDNYELFQEVSILNDLDHPNILKVFQTVETFRSYYIVLENADGGPLASQIKTSCNEVLVGKYMHDIFSAIYYMHNHDVIHCDLHLGNILLSNTSSTSIVKIVGFAHSQKISEIQDFDIKLLHYEYISPEILEGKFDEKTDI